MGIYRDKQGRLHHTVDGTPWDRTAAKRMTRVDEPSGSQEPARNASRDDWAAYAREVAETSDEANAIDGLSRDELVELFAGRENG